MMRNIATTLDHAPAPQPTSADCDAALAALDGLLDLDATVMVSSAENQRLLANAFELESSPNTDDEISIEAVAPVVPFVARITQRPAAPALAFSSSPPAPRQPSPAAIISSASISGARARVTPVRESNQQLLVVAGIWAMALSLFAMLAVMVTT